MNGTALPTPVNPNLYKYPKQPAGPAPAIIPPAPPPSSNGHNHVLNPHNHAHSHPNTPPLNRTNQTNHVNGAHPPKAKKKNEPPPVDPATMYESLKSRIAVLEEEETQEEEEERRFAEEAQKSVKGMGENVVHAKYIELFAEFKRLERDHAKEKQKLVKDKDAAKSQLTKTNQSKSKMENLARELQKDNKKLRDDSKRLAQCVEEAQDEIIQMKNDMAKRVERVKIQDIKYREMPDIVVKVVCKYRAELFFKISRKTKFSRLFNAWTDRMESTGGAGKKGDLRGTQSNGASATATNKLETATQSSVQFVFSHGGRSLEADQTPEEAGLEDGDEILAVEMMDLTEGFGTEILDDCVEPRRQKLKKYWTDDPREAKKVMEDMFDGVVRERLKEVLRQYELRERHFECVIRSKELEVLLSRARAAEQKQLSEGEKARADKSEEENAQLRRDLETAQNGQSMLIDKLIACCKEPNAERTQRLFASLREELEKRGSKFSGGSVGD